MEKIRAYLDEVSGLIASLPVEQLDGFVDRLMGAYDEGRQLFLLGNGGSAATASHFACDLAKGTRRDGPPTFHVMALTDNVPLLTAWANDTGYERVFAEQLASLAQPGDVLVAISASGNSPNVLAAAETARARDLVSIGLTGRTGGRLASLVDIVVRAPSDRIEVVEDAHLIVAHSLCVAARERLAACAHDEIIAQAAIPSRRTGR
jgi:D-sedoheptulose 7-phosphate isomerase